MIIVHSDPKGNTFGSLRNGDVFSLEMDGDTKPALYMKVMNRHALCIRNPETRLTFDRTVSVKFYQATLNVRRVG